MVQAARPAKAPPRQPTNKADKLIGELAGKTPAAPAALLPVTPTAQPADKKHS